MKQLEKEREETRRLESDLAGKNGDMETLIEQIKMLRARSISEAVKTRIRSQVEEKRRKMMADEVNSLREKIQVLHLRAKSTKERHINNLQKMHRASSSSLQHLSEQMKKQAAELHLIRGKLCSVVGDQDQK